MITIMDIAGTNQGAYRLLRNRVKTINDEPDMHNMIVCPDGAWTAHLKAADIPLKIFSLSRGLNFFKIVRELLECYQIIVRYSPDILHTHSSKIGVIARICGWIYNMTHSKQIIMLHQVHGFHFIHLRGLKRQIYLFIEICASLLSQYMLLQNRYEFDYVRHCFPKSTRPFYLGNGIDMAAIEKWKGKNNRPQSSKRIVCIARIEPVKNHSYLIDALVYLSRHLSFTQFQLCLIGEGDPHIISQLKKQIAHHHLESRCQFHGVLPHEEAIEIMAHADAAVLTSLKEGLPRALIEAHALGIPAVVTDVPGTNEVVVDGVTGFCIPLGVPEQFGQALHRLLSDSSLHEKMGAAAQSHVAAQFDEAEIIARLRSLYRTTMEQMASH